MDVEDLDARARLLAAPLRETLLAAWEQVDFTFDVAAATDRPGAPIGVSWQDGPTVAEVTRKLAPRWSDNVDSPSGHRRQGGPAGLLSDDGEADGGESGHAYPVTLRRSYSAVATAAAILTLHDAGQLAVAAAAGRHGCADVLLRWLAGLSLPGGAERDLLPRAELLSDIATTALGGQDGYDWARWLTGDGGHILTHVLPGALTETAG